MYPSVDICVVVSVKSCDFCDNLNRSLTGRCIIQIDKGFVITDGAFQDGKVAPDLFDV